MKIGQQVENILKASALARNSDKELLIIYMQKFGMDLTGPQMEMFRKMPAFETITRCRRIIQEQGKYPASPAIEEARYKKYVETKESIGYQDPEAILAKMGYKILPFGE